MKKSTISGCGALLALVAIALPGRAAEDVEFEADPLVTGVYSLSWTGETGWTYFIQHSEDMVDWDYFPIIESGVGATIEWGFTSSDSRLFLRLQGSDLPTGGDALSADFDSDGVSNNAELGAGTDPLAWLDLDGDNLPDDWESYYQVGEPELDADGDGLSNLIEFAIYGTDPNTADSPISDSDSDGVPDTLDAFPDDTTTSAPTGAASGDSTAPTITLSAPSGAVAL